jgi:hypothetical protein
MIVRSSVRVRDQEENDFINQSRKYLSRRFESQQPQDCKANKEMRDLLTNFFETHCDPNKTLNIGYLIFIQCICDIMLALRASLEIQQLRTVLYSRDKVRDNLYDLYFMNQLVSVSDLPSIKNSLKKNPDSILELLDPQTLASLYHVKRLKDSIHEDITNEDIAKIIKLRYPKVNSCDEKNNNIFKILLDKEIQSVDIKASIDLAFNIHSIPIQFLSDDNFLKFARSFSLSKSTLSQAVEEDKFVREGLRARKKKILSQFGLLVRQTTKPRDKEKSAIRDYKLIAIYDQNVFRIISDLAGISTKASHRKVVLATEQKEIETEPEPEQKHTAVMAESLPTYYRDNVVATEQKEIKTAQQPKQSRKDDMASSYKPYINSYIDSLRASNNEYGCKRARELALDMLNPNPLRTLAKFIKTGQTESDKHFSSFFKSMSRCSGTGKNSLRGMIIDKILLNNHHTQESKRENAINAILASSISDIEKLLNDDTTILDKMLQEKQFHGYVSSHGERWI